MLSNKCTPRLSTKNIAVVPTLLALFAFHTLIAGAISFCIVLWWRYWSSKGFILFIAWTMIKETTTYNEHVMISILYIFFSKKNILWGLVQCNRLCRRFQLSGNSNNGQMASLKALIQTISYSDRCILLLPGGMFARQNSYRFFCWLSTRI